eukprot:scaffold3323_cov279-Pinguiococcus_pyrenoidosus.AAC.1
MGAPLNFNMCEWTALPVPKHRTLEGFRKLPQKSTAFIARKGQRVKYQLSSWSSSRRVQINPNLILNSIPIQPNLRNPIQSRIQSRTSNSVDVKTTYPISTLFSNPKSKVDKNRKIGIPPKSVSSSHLERIIPPFTASPDPRVEAVRKRSLLGKAAVRVQQRVEHSKRMSSEASYVKVRSQRATQAADAGQLKLLRAVLQLRNLRFRKPSKRYPPRKRSEGQWTECLKPLSFRRRRCCATSAVRCSGSSRRTSTRSHTSTSGRSCKVPGAAYRRMDEMRAEHPAKKETCSGCRSRAGGKAKKQSCLPCHPRLGLDSAQPRRPPLPKPFHRLFYVFDGTGKAEADAFQTSPRRGVLHQPQFGRLSVLNLAKAQGHSQASVPRSRFQVSARRTSLPEGSDTELLLRSPLKHPLCAEPREARKTQQHPHGKRKATETHDTCTPPAEAEASVPASSPRSA